MKKYFSFAFLLVCFICTKSYAQDLIVTNVGDSLSCKIILQTKDYIHFSYTKYNHNTVRVLTVDRIKAAKPGFYTKPDSLNMMKSVASTGSSRDSLAGNDAKKETEKETENTHDSVKKILPEWRFGINGGYAYRLFRPRLQSTPYELKYIDELKSGYSFGADAFYFPWQKAGFGLKYNVYKSKGERDIRTKNDISIQFIGASAAHRMLFQNKKTVVVTAFWLGYQPYQNVTRFVGQDYTLKANTMGWGVSVGVYHPLGKKLAISAGLSCFMGSIYKFKKEIKGRTEIVNLSKDSFEDLSRAEFTIGLKFIK